MPDARRIVQARNVIKMAVQDIAKQAAEIERLADDAARWTAFGQQKAKLRGRTRSVSSAGWSFNHAHLTAQLWSVHQAGTEEPISMLLGRANPERIRDERYRDAHREWCVNEARARSPLARTNT